MRTFLIFSNIILVSIIAFMSCNKTPVPAAVTTARPCPDCTDHNLTPFSGVSTETALKMAGDYRITNPPLPGTENEEDARSVWFSAETLKNFLWKAEKEICRRGCAGNLKLGVRIYYGRYPNANLMSLNDDLAGLDLDFASHHTVFMVPTFQDPLDPQTHWDFDPWHWGTSTCRPKTMRDWFASGNPKPFGRDKSLVLSIGEKQFFKNADGSLSDPLNHGNLIPPRPPVGTGY
jgi:hypothetical protein